MVYSSNVKGKRKAAILLVALGPELSAEIFKHLDEKEVEQLTLEIATLERTSSETKEEIVEEFAQMCQAQEYVTQGGIEYARNILEKALGTHKAIEILNKLSMSLRETPFDFMKATDPEHVLSFIENEHPQTIALIMAHLPPDRAASILAALSPELQAEVALRMALMDGAAPDVVKEVEQVLEKKLLSFGRQDFSSAGGIKPLVEVLNNVDRGTEKSIIERLEEQNPTVAEEIKRMLFVFEDIIILDDRAIQQALREVDTKDLALALKAASDEVKSRVFKNMSERASAMLKEDMEFLGPVRLRTVEEAQQRIVAVVRKLEETGEIVISRGREDEIIV